MAENLIRLKQINQADLSGYISSVSQEALMVPNLVYNTGDQTISGNKTFANNIAVSGTGIFNSLDLSSVDTISLSGVDITITNGVVILTNPITAPNLVYNSGTQGISGIKTFFDSGIFSLSGALASGLPNNPLSVVGSGNTYLQLNIQNRATGATASADLVITANNGNDSSNFINLGINNVGYSDPSFTNGTGLDGYLFIDGGNLDIGTRTAGRAIEFHAGGTTLGSTIARISQSGLNIVSGNLTVGGTGVLLSGQSPAISDSLVTHIRPNGTNNVFVSSTALASTSFGSQNNIAVGVNALTANVGGDDNVAMGHEALYSNTNGNGNIGIGRDALKNANGPDANICIGTQAGDTIQAGGSNIIIGHEADVDDSSRQRCIVLGRSATSPAIDGSLAIGGTAGNVMANLTGTTAGAAAVGEYLNIYINGVQRKIALLLP